MFDSVRQKNNFNTIIKYDLDMVSYDYDYVSISITGNVDKNKDILETKFWINDYLDFFKYNEFIEILNESYEGRDYSFYKSNI